MKPQIKARILSSVIALSLITVLAVIVKLILLDNIVDMEKQQILQNIELASSGMGSELDSLGKEVSNWAQRDDAYAFMQNPSSEFIARNLPDSIFSSHRISAIIFVSSSGKTVYSAQVVPDKEGTRPVPEKVTALLVHKSF